MGFLEDIPVIDSLNYEKQLIGYLHRKETKILEEIEKEAYLTSQIHADLNRVLTEFNQQWHQAKG
jgi:F0F1-type ATP synthase alpha subunit